MKTITARNVNDALSDALWWLHTAGVRVNSRNGPVLMSPVPVTTTYLRPDERVLFSDLRDANPFFHLMESLWMLGGYNDVKFPAQFAKQIQEYSDDGSTLNGAYGYRWRRYFGNDQIREVIATLRQDPSTRRAVLSMWDGTSDLFSANAGSKDVPCNTHIYFSAVLGKLDMTVCCRSNDAVWGAYGANAVHFSVLQQFIAEATGIPLGVYYQVSNNLHVYTDRPDVQRLISKHVLYASDDRYAQDDTPTRVTPLLQPQENIVMFYADIHRLVWSGAEVPLYCTEFFTDTVAPMQEAHALYRVKEYDSARNTACGIMAQDWMMACVDWLDRREVVRDAK